MLSTEDTKSYFDRVCKTLFVTEPPLRSISLHMGSYNHILTVKFIIVILYNQSQESCFYYSVFNNSYWYLVFRMPMFVDTELSCDILFRGRAFALISEKDKFHVMYFKPMKIMKLLSYVI